MDFICNFVDCQFNNWFSFILLSTRFIRMVYEPVFGLDNIVKRFSEVTHDFGNHFVEGLQYNLDEAVIMTAAMVPDHEVDYTNVRLVFQ